jgi:tetratricopeptide (TPR) repeat protein
LAAQTDAAREPVLGLLELVRALQAAGDDAAADRLLWEALQARPQEVVLLAVRGNRLAEQRRWDGAAACYAAARALRPELGASLAHALLRSGKVDEGLALYDRLTAGAKDNPWLHYQRGRALHDLGRFEEAAGAYREASRLDPNDPWAHGNLGTVLEQLNRHEEAETEYQEVLRLKPDSAEAHTNFAAIRFRQGRFPEAEKSCREAIRLNPELAMPYANLSYALAVLGRLPEAEKACREAIRLDPELAGAYINLGLILGRQGRPSEAEAVSREVIRLDPDDSRGHNNLGTALFEQGRYEEAVGFFRAAVRLDSNNVVAQCNVGHALRELGRFAEALEELRRGHEQGTKTPGWRSPSAAWVRRCERLIELDGKLPALLRGAAEPADVAECLEFARLCQRYRRLPLTATRLYADAFAEAPKVAEDIDQRHRYGAACAAAQGAVGQGADARPLPDKVALMLRRQALAWLRADLALSATAAERDEAGRQAVRRRLAQWRQNPDLASVRDGPALDRLAEDERRPWRRLWDDVADLLKKVEEK